MHDFASYLQQLPASVVVVEAEGAEPACLQF